MESFLSIKEIKKIGLKSFGKDVKISRHAMFYGAENIQIGNNVRIDDYCIISGNVKFGSNIHISPYCVLYGSFGIEFGDYSGLSARCTIYSASDDFSGNYMVGSQNDINVRNLIGGSVIISKYVQIGASSVIFPGLKIHEGVAIGAMSLVNKDLEPWKIYAGIPVRILKERSKKLLEYI